MVQTKYSSRATALRAQKMLTKSNPKWVHSVKGKTLYSKWKPTKKKPTRKKPTRKRTTAPKKTDWANFYNPPIDYF